ncbi:MAG: 2-phosphoglycerate kinase [Bacteroidia bacterium]|nr:2-phosphoglycerate kinase [Bacteroidia bacterium]
MVILINGASCTGKTYLAQQILQQFSYTYYSIDHLKMGLFRGDPNCGFTPTDDDEKITKHLAPILEGIIRTALENNQNLTIEGCYFDPASIKRLQNEYPDELIALSIVMTDKYCANQFQHNIKKYRCVIENRQYTEERSLEQFIAENRKVADFSHTNGFHVFEVDKDYNSTVEEILNFLKIRVARAGF